MKVQNIALPLADEVVLGREVVGRLLRNGLGLLDRQRVTANVLDV
jgi:hypothetical protein